MRISLAVIYGGAGREHDVSVMGYRNLVRNIDKEKYEVLEIFIDKSGAWYFIRGDESYPTFPVRLGDKSGFLVSGRLVSLDVALPLLHGDMGEDGNIQGLLTSAGIPFIGEGTRTGALTSDKSYTKTVSGALGIPTVKSLTLTDEYCERAIDAMESVIGYPAFIKPVSLGSSVGASGAYSRDEALLAYSRARALDTKVLIEELVSPKRELECAVLKYGDSYTVTPPSEIMIDGEYGYSEKYKLGTRLEVEADIPEEIKRKLNEYCHVLIDGMGIYSMSRIDFFLSRDRIFLNEINTMPGFTKDSLYLKMLDRAGIPCPSVIDALVESAMERSR